LISYARDFKHHLSLVYENTFYGQPPAVQLRSPLEEEWEEEVLEEEEEASPAHRLLLRRYSKQKR
jgi:hypothetical protein